MWAGEKHKEALATLKYGILNNKGFLLLTGDVGTGKTTLINALIESLEDDVIYASVPDPNLDYLDFINFIAFSFGLPSEFRTKGDFLIQFRKFLVNAHQNGKKVLLLIDEAQLLTDEVLEQIRLLSNIDQARTKLLNIFFVGQNEFNDVISKSSNRAVRQRLTLNYNIDPLTSNETDKYIQHRLKVAGTTRKLFAPDAVKEIFHSSGGFPRRINIICDHCLLSGYVKEQKRIGTSIVSECVRDLELSFNRATGVPEPEEEPFPTLLKEPPSHPQERDKLIPVMFVICLILALLAFFFYHPGLITQGKHYTQNVASIFKSRWNALRPPTPEEKAPALDVQQNKSLEQPVITGPVDDPMQPSEIAHVAVNPPAPPPQTFQLKSDPEPGTDDIQGEPLAPLKPLPEEKKLVIRFKHNSNDFTAKDLEKIDEFAESAKRYPKVKLVVTGYTDSVGNPEYNRKLSKFRANIVKSFLMGKGVDPDQIIERGLGSENPVQSNATSLGRQMNRRVEIEIIEDAVKTPDESNQDFRIGMRR